MNKKIWDLYAPIHEKAMRADQKYYIFTASTVRRWMMYSSCWHGIRGSDILVRKSARLPYPGRTR